jgi:hypothetical protein
MDGKRKRNWYQFSMRTLFAGVTLLAVPLGYLSWQARIVREREALASERADDRVVGVNVDDSEVPLVRRWLGDHEYMAIWFNRNEPDELMQRYRAVFPEATIETPAVIWSKSDSVMRKSPMRLVRRRDGRAIPNPRSRR